MALSGYLFAKLLDGKKIIYTQFYWNRFLRLAPLLLVVILIVGLQEYFAGRDMLLYAKKVANGVIMPTLPNGGWSITTEFHFYLLLPLLLFLVRKWKYALLVVIVAAVALRTLLYYEMGQIQTLSYWTIVGRIDQFVLGMLAFQFRAYITGRPIIAILCFLLFASFYWYFDSLGGFYKHPSYPSPSRLWIVLPTIEGLAYAVLICWYDTSVKPSNGRVSRFIALIGTYSYSIYLIHLFFVFQLAAFINQKVMHIPNIYMAILISVPCFLLMMPLGYLSYRFIETPFLRFRTRYIVESKPAVTPALDMQDERSGA